MTTHTETRWAIARKRGLYYETLENTRKDAIDIHCDWFYWDWGHVNIWRKCRRNGDRAVKVTITYEYPD